MLHNPLSHSYSKLIPWSPHLLPNPIQPILTVAATYVMPMHNERAAPTFNSSKPRELFRYFEDLEQLMKHAAIDNKQEKKQQVLHYVDFSTEQIWKTFPEFLDNNETYTNFKDKILVHYLDTSGSFVYSIKDMDLLIGECQHIGISSTKDLSNYHLQFILQSPLGSLAKDSLVTWNNRELTSEPFSHPYSLWLWITYNSNTLTTTQTSHTRWKKYTTLLNSSSIAIPHLLRT